MTLKEILKGIDYEFIQGDINVEVNDICYDSREIKKKDAFVCLVGIDTNGHQYIQNAIQKGCNCIIICQEIKEKLDNDITIIKVKDTRTTLSYLSANLFQHPANDLIKIAITGTKGKTSTSWMIKNILEQKGEKVGIIGTIGTIIDGKLIPHKNTTPESYKIQKYMREMVNKKTKYLVMEVSSQALKVGRVNNIFFDYAIFTNLSLDHIGPREHPTYEDYQNSKRKLFIQTKVGILNKDDSAYSFMIQDNACSIYSYGSKDCDLQIGKIMQTHEKDFLGTTFQLSGKIQDTFQIPAPGNFSAYNATAAILLSLLLDTKVTDIKEGLSQFHVPGRCEIINIGHQNKVIIDFAHNKISMESIIKTMREYHPNRIITLFGCGGGRSRERRKELGTTAGTLSDFSIITTDNPRNDDIDEINQNIVEGMEEVGGKYIIIKDRKEAIYYALKNATQNDIILLLGKGHETYQEIKGEKYDFNEKEIINTYLKEQKNEQQN